VASSQESAEDAAFAIAADEYPTLRVGRYRRRLDELGARLARRVAPLEAIGRARLLCEFVHHEVGFRGSDDYDDPRANYLNDVIDRRTGSPVALGVVLIGVGRRAGIDVRGVAFPGHFLIRIEGHYADPFEGGAPIDRTRLVGLARETLRDAREANASLEPVGARTIAVRLLLNLQRIHRQRADHARGMVVCDRLFELTRSPLHRIDRGMHALALGATRSAINDFESYLKVHHEGDGATRARELLRKARDQTLAPAN
jgi:regulator of sirC expression with transglutaminase-like and TPR domain